MKKLLAIIFLFVTISIYSQTYSGALKLQVYEKTKDGEGRRALINEAVIVVLNDSTKHSLTTDQEGYVAVKNLIPGKYNVKAIRIDCQAAEVKGILIGEGKTAYVTITLTCQSYLNSLTKKEKKKLGIK